MIQLAAILLSPNLEIPANKKSQQETDRPFFFCFFWDRQIRRQIYVLDANPGADRAPIWSKQSWLLEAKHVGYLAH